MYWMRLFYGWTIGFSVITGHCGHVLRHALRFLCGSTHGWQSLGWAHIAMWEGHSTCGNKCSLHLNKTGNQSTEIGGTT
jgi:hypothetical protein